MLDEADREALAAGGAGHVELEEGMPGDEPAVVDGGVYGPAAGDRLKPGGQAGGDDLAGQVDEVPVAPPRSGDHGDHTVRVE